MANTTPPPPLCLLCLLAGSEQEELMRTLVKTNHDVLPALLEPSPVLEYNAQIYSQVRASRCRRVSSFVVASLVGGNTFLIMHQRKRETELGKYGEGFSSKRYHHLVLVADNFFSSFF